MDLPWGDEKTKQFVTNVGIITSNGPFGPNVMACEWTHHISYSPGLIAVCIGPGKATYANIQATKQFGVNIASTEQTVMSSISGGNSGKEIDKIKVLEELGFKFYQAKKIKTLMIQDAVLNLECKLIREILLGDHTMFVGEVLEASISPDKVPLVLHNGRYGQVVHNVPKPSKEDREKMEAIIAKYRKNT